MDRRDGRPAAAWKGARGVPLHGLLCAPPGSGSLQLAYRPRAKEVCGPTPSACTWASAWHRRFEERQEVRRGRQARAVQRGGSARPPTPCRRLHRGWSRRAPPEAAALPQGPPPARRRRREGTTCGWVGVGGLRQAASCIIRACMPIEWRALHQLCAPVPRPSSSPAETFAGAPWPTASGSGRDGMPPRPRQWTGRRPLGLP